MPQQNPIINQATEAAKALGVPEEIAQWVTQIAVKAGSQATRSYHTTPHFEYLMGGATVIGALLRQHGINEETIPMIQDAYRIAGRDHDVVYLSADKQTILPAILDKSYDGRSIPNFSEQPEDYIQAVCGIIDQNYHLATHEQAAPLVTSFGLGIGKYLKPELRDFPEAGSWLRSYTVRDENGAAQLLPEHQQNLRIALAAFDKQYDSSLYPLDGGQDEFLSCLHSLETNPGISLKAKVAIAALHQATIPFQQSDSIEKLIKRLAAISVDDKPVLAAQEADAIGLAAAHFANRDVGSFKGSKKQFQQESIALMQESRGDFDASLSSKQRIERRLGFLEYLCNNLDPDKRTIFRNYTYQDEEENTSALYSDDQIKLDTQTARHQIEDEIKRLQAMQKIAKQYEERGTTTDIGTIAKAAGRINSVSERNKGKL